MDLIYQRCPEDGTTIISANTAVGDNGEVVELGINEVATVLAVRSLMYTVTMAIKGGVSEDFPSRVATGLAAQMGGDIHALCPVIGIVCEAFALMSGGKTALDSHGLVNVFPSKGCPPWMRGYFNGQMEDSDETRGS